MYARARPRTDPLGLLGANQASEGRTIVDENDIILGCLQRKRWTLDLGCASPAVAPGVNSPPFI